MLFSTGIFFLGRCWPSAVNNPVPGALPGQSPPCERDFKGGFAAKLMLKVRLAFLFDQTPQTKNTVLPSDALCRV